PRRRSSALRPMVPWLAPSGTLTFHPSSNSPSGLRLRPALNRQTHHREDLYAQDYTSAAPCELDGREPVLQNCTLTRSAPRHRPDVCRQCPVAKPRPQAVARFLTFHGFASLKP